MDKLVIEAAKLSICLCDVGRKGKCSSCKILEKVGEKHYPEAK